MENRAGNAVAIGNFDGFHLGHQSIVKHTLSIASKYSLGNVLVTFKPNPRIYFGIEDKLIFSEEKKSESLKSSGISILKNIDFNLVFDMEGNDFIDKYLLEDLSMRFLIVGDNFRLGKGREWGIPRLIEYGKEKKFKIRVVESEFFGNDKISSSLIRSLLRKGDLIKAKNMLGKEYVLDGVVERGNRIGRRLGFRTINITNENCLLPDGVYMTRVLVKGAVFNGATYIGSRSPQNGEQRKIETHLFDFNESIYNEPVEVNFLQFRRQGIMFKTEEALVDQIKKDIDSIKFDFKKEVC